MRGATIPSPPMPRCHRGWSCIREGDVWARLMVRVEEAREAARLIEAALEALPSGSIAVLDRLLCQKATGAFGLVEGWRGPIWHWVVAGKNNTLRRVKIKDPSLPIGRRSTTPF